MPGVLGIQIEIAPLPNAGCTGCSDRDSILAECRVYWYLDRDSTFAECRMYGVSKYRYNFVECRVYGVSR